MKVYLAADHAGFELKEKIKVFLLEKKIEIEDCGAFEFNKDDDYPDFICKAAQAVSEEPENSRGIIIGGSGQAEMMLANKYFNIRCALFYNTAIPIEPVDAAGRISDDPYEVIKLTREHNNANMISLGARFVDDEKALKAIELWINEPFSGEERHIRRINKIEKIEETLGKTNS